MLEAHDEPPQQTEISHCPKNCLTLKLGHSVRAPPQGLHCKHLGRMMLGSPLSAADQSGLSIFR